MTMKQKTKRPAKKNTPEAARGRLFLEKLRLWNMLHADGGKTIYNKRTLAREFFGMETVRERHRRHVQRLINVLVMAGLVSETDSCGRVLMPGELEKMLKKNKFAERWWRYSIQESES